MYNLPRPKADIKFVFLHVPVTHDLHKITDHDNLKTYPHFTDVIVSVADYSSRLFRISRFRRNHQPFHIHTKKCRDSSFAALLCRKKVDLVDLGAVHSSVNGKHFENGAFRKRSHHDNNVILLANFSSTTKPK